MILMSLCSKVIYETQFLQEELELVLLGCCTCGTGVIGRECAQTPQNLLTKKTRNQKILEVVSIRASCWCCQGGNPSWFQLLSFPLPPHPRFAHPSDPAWAFVPGWWISFCEKRAEMSPELVVESSFPSLSNSQNNSNLSNDPMLTLQGLCALWASSDQRVPGNSSFSWKSHPGESLANVNLALEDKAEYG